MNVQWTWFPNLYAWNKSVLVDMPLNQSINQTTDIFIRTGISYPLYCHDSFKTVTFFSILNDILKWTGQVCYKNYFDSGYIKLAILKYRNISSYIHANVKELWYLLTFIERIKKFKTHFKFILIISAKLRRLKAESLRFFPAVNLITEGVDVWMISYHFRNLNNNSRILQ